MRKSTVFCEYASIQLKLKESQAGGSSVSVDPSDNLLDENWFKSFYNDNQSFLTITIKSNISLILLYHHVIK